MLERINRRGQVTIPKRIRDELRLVPGGPVESLINPKGEVVLQTARGRNAAKGVPRECFEAVCGAADVLWGSDELMNLLHPEE
jgi:AbrB family looped-hinge helix DNA binding protein